MKWKSRIKTGLPIPAWLFVGIMVVFDEVILHLWTMESFTAGRFLAVLTFAAALGGVLALLTSLFPPNIQKWVAVAAAALLAVFYLTEYFIHDAYQVFMPLSTVMAGAEGVVTNYLSVVASLLVKNLWRILLMLLPIVLYAVLGRPKRANWAVRTALAAAAVVLYLASVGVVFGVNLDAEKLTNSSSFHNSAEAFGLHVAMALDMVQNTANEEPEFLQQPLETKPAAPVKTTPPSSGLEATENVPEETELPVVYREHTLGLDFAALAEAEENSKVAAIHSYVASLPIAMENEYTGLFEGKNLIFITAEAFSAHVVDPELTPTLYRMANEGILFTDYYQPTWGSGTTGGEYSNLLSLVPSDGSCMLEVVQQDCFQTIGKQLQARGYSSAAFHNNDYTYYKRNITHTYLGYDLFMGYGNGMEEGVTRAWPESDQEMFDFTIPQYIDQQPFSLYYMTVSGHATYTFINNDMAEKNKDKVENLNYSLPVRAYLACQIELENAMASLLSQLEEAGIADDTVVVIAADHYPYGLAPSSTWGDGKNYLAELYGANSNIGVVRDKSALIIWSGCLEGQNIVVDTPTQSLDILPTLSNLFGVEYDSRLMAGRDVFSDQQAVVFWTDNSWKTEKGFYRAATRVFTPVEGVEVDEDYVANISAYVKNKLTYSRSVAKQDYFNYVVAALEELDTPTQATEETEESP